MFRDIIKKSRGVYRVLLKTNPMETVTSDDVKFYLNLGRQTAGRTLFYVYFYYVKG